VKVSPSHGEFAGFRLSGEIYSLLFRSLDFFVSFFIKKKRKDNGAAKLRKSSFTYD